MLNLVRGIIISAALIAVCWWVLQGSISFQSCIQQNQKQSSDNQSENYISAFATSANAYRDCLGEFVHDRKDEILVAFTVILAFSTIFLWVATRDLVKGSEKTARRQLRAYVFVGEAKFVTDEKVGSLAVLKIMNSGQTPAYKVVVLAGAKTFVGAEIRTFERLKRGAHTSQMDVPAGGVAQHEVKLGEILNERGIEAIKSGVLELYLFGEVEYRDAFGKWQTTTFRFVMGGHHKWPRDDRFVVCQEGNKAT